MATKNIAAGKPIVIVKKTKRRKSNVVKLNTDFAKRLRKADVEGKLKQFEDEIKATANKLIRRSTVDFEHADSNKQKLELMLKVTINAIPIAEGLFRYKPGQSTGYLLTNLINQSQGVLEQLENYVDYDKLSKNCMREVIEPKMEGIILELGKIIRDTMVNLEDTVSVKEKKKVKHALDGIFKKYGGAVQEKIEEIEEELADFMKEG